MNNSPRVPIIVSLSRLDNPSYISSLRQNNFIVRLYDEQPYNLSTVENYVTNHSRPVKIRCIGHYDCLLSYVKINDIPYRIVKINRPSNIKQWLDELPNMTVKVIDKLIFFSIANNDEESLKFIINSGYEYNGNYSCSSLSKMSVESINLALKYHDYIKSDQLYIYLTLIERDMKLRYCARYEYRELTNSLTTDILLYLTLNRRFIDWLKRYKPAIIPSINRIMEEIAINTPPYNEEESDFDVNPLLELASYLLTEKSEFNVDYIPVLLQYEEIGISFLMKIHQYRVADLSGYLKYPKP